MRRPRQKLLKLCVVSLLLIAVVKVYFDYIYPRRPLSAYQDIQSKQLHIETQPEKEGGQFQRVFVHNSKPTVNHTASSKNDSTHASEGYIQTVGAEESPYKSTLDFLELLTKQGFLAAKRSNNEDVHLLYSTYMGSGSTSTASLLTSTGVFYMNEPLAAMTLWGYLTNNRTLCSQKNAECHMLQNSKVDPFISTVRSFASSTEYPVDTARRVLTNIFSCRFEAGFEAFIRRVEKVSDGVSELSWRDFKDCLGRNPDKERIQACLPVLTKLCQSLHKRMTKVVRLSVDSLQPLLESDPQLKVIHMFRDPRSIMAARLHKSPHYTAANTTYSVTGNTKSLCSKMLADFNSGLQILQKFPSQFVMLRYEDFSGPFSSLISKKLLDFAQLPNTTDISDITMVNDVFADYWHQELTLDIFSNITAVCKETIVRLGYSQSLKDLPLLKNGAKYTK